jgi:hypothetical protein
MRAFQYKRWIKIGLSYVLLLFGAFVGVFFIDRWHGRVLDQFPTPSALSKNLVLGRLITLSYKIEPKSLEKIFNFAEKHDFYIKSMVFNSRKNKITVMFDPELPNKFNEKVIKSLAGGSKTNFKKEISEKTITFIHLDE